MFGILSNHKSFLVDPPPLFKVQAGYKEDVERTQSKKKEKAAKI